MISRTEDIKPIPAEIPSSNSTHREIQPDISLILGLFCLAIAVIIRLACCMLVQRSGFFVATMDEPIRSAIAFNWVEQPFWFTHWDGIWLSGGFAAWGLLFKLIPNPLVAVQLGSLALHIVSLACAFWLARLLTRSTLAASLSALLLAPATLFIWTGNGPLAEPLMIGPFLLGLGLTWQYLNSPAEGPRARWLTLAAGLCLFLAMSVHYLAWMAVAVGAPFYLASLVARRRSLSRGAWAGAMIIPLLACAFPLIWVLGSWHYLGHPLQFLRNQAAFLHDTGGYSQITFIERLAVYPREFIRSLLPLLALVPLLVLGARPMLRTHAKATRMLGGLLLYVAALLGFMLLTIVGGGAAQSPFRSLVIPFTLTVVALGSGAGLAFDRLDWRRLSRPAADALLALGLTGYAAWCGYNLINANRFEARLAEHPPHDMLAMGVWLRQEVRHPMELADFSPQTRIGVYADRHVEIWTNYFQYASGAPKRFLELKNLDESSLAACDYLLINQHQPPPHFSLIATIGNWRIYKQDA